MTQIQSLTVETRKDLGTGSARAVRRTGRIPAIIYGGDSVPESVTVDIRDATKALYQEGFLSQLIELDIAGNKIQVLPRGVQVHPVSDAPIHMDFQRVTKECKVKVAIPIHYINEDKAPGLKRGGILNIVTHEITAECDADKIPKFITIDLAGMALGESVHLDKVVMPAGLSPLKLDAKATLATIVAPSVLKSKDAEESEEAETTAAAEEKKAK